MACSERRASISCPLSFVEVLCLTFGSTYIPHVADGSPIRVLLPPSALAVFTTLHAKFAKPQQAFHCANDLHNFTMLKSNAMTSLKTQVRLNDHVGRWPGGVCQAGAVAGRRFHGLASHLHVTRSCYARLQLFPRAGTCGNCSMSS